MREGCDALGTILLLSGPLPSLARLDSRGRLSHVILAES
jgi:hypothetical protein